MKTYCYEPQNAEFWAWEPVVHFLLCVHGDVSVCALHLPPHVAEH